jgi:hypothetical protein
MGDLPQQQRPSARAGLNRRQFLGRAAVAGTLIWTVPTIVSVEPAGAAERHSARPKPPVEPVGAVVEPPVEPPEPKPVAATHNGPAPQLPFTGDSQLVELGAGLTAIAGGAALIAWGREAEHAARRAAV